MVKRKLKARRICNETIFLWCRGWAEMLLIGSSQWNKSSPVPVRYGFS
jgi:hypothetical protein